MYLFLWPGPHPGRLLFLDWPCKQISEKDFLFIPLYLFEQLLELRNLSETEGKKRGFPTPDHGVPGETVLLFFQSSFSVHQHLYWYLGNSIFISVTSTYMYVFRSGVVLLFCFCCVGFFFCWLVVLCPAVFLPGSLPFLEGTSLIPVSEPQLTGQNFYTPSMPSHSQPKPDFLPVPRFQAIRWKRTSNFNFLLTNFRET